MHLDQETLSKLKEKINKDKLYSYLKLTSKKVRTKTLKLIGEN